MHRESPTDATVMTHPSIMTKVTVVPDVRAEKAPKQILSITYTYGYYQAKKISKNKQFATVMQLVYMLSNRNNLSRLCHTKISLNKASMIHEVQVKMIFVFRFKS